MLSCCKWSDYDSCVYLKIVNGLTIYLLIYVDDMLIAAKYKLEIAKLKAKLKKEFDIKDLGAAKKILRIKIVRDRKSKNYISIREVMLKMFF